MFVDRVNVKVRGGNGGHGCVSFRREAFVPRGGPDGGDGGHGGSVILTTCEHEESLVALRYMNHYEAENGGGGMGKGRHGARGEDVLVPVPVGTLVREIGEDGERTLLADLDRPQQRLVVAGGGRGGRGNARFVSSTNRAPRQVEEGTLGEERELELELKLVADVGLVGFPNAGKSSLLGAISDAHPETAPYPFTTLTPHIGVVQDGPYSRYRVADIPGLIEGAHRNVGLGHEFLRHVERTRVFAYVLDTAGIDGRAPWDDLAALMAELEEYETGLSRRPAVVVANKMDEEAAAENLATLRDHTDLPVFPVCAVLEEGTDALIQALRDLLPKPGD